MAKVANSNLHGAKKAKKDEFYTQFSDIENELKHYKEHFKDKIVLCNCDDPKVSQFFRYFANKFYDLGLKKLISTCYKNASGEEFYHELENEKTLFKSKREIKGEKSCYFIYEGKDEKGVELRENAKIDTFIANLKPKPLLNDKEYIKEHAIKREREREREISSGGF